MAARNKDSSSKLHEKHQVILAGLLKEEENKFCADCHAKGPRWASWNLGVFLCIRCAGIHRNLGVHLSRVKSVNLDAWTPEQIDSIQNGGNRRAKETFEANLPENFRRPQDDYSLEVFIRGKYERKEYISKGPKASTGGGGKVAASAGGGTTKAKEEKPKKDFLKVDHSDRKYSLAPPGKELTFMPRPASTPDLHTISKTSTSPKARPRGIPKSTANGTLPKPASKSKPLTGSVGNLILTVDSPGSSTTTRPTNTKPVDLLTGLPLSSSSSPSSLSPSVASSQEPTIGTTQPNQVKDNIMSLYSTPQQAAYTVQGMPVNAYYYQQQQAAAMHMAQAQAQAQQRYQQVQQVQRQMEQLKLQQQQAAPTGGFGSGGGGMGGQTLNPTLW